MDEEKEQQQPEAQSKPARPVDPEREAKIAAAKAMAAQVAAARAAAASPPPAAAAPPVKQRPPDPEREAKIAAAKAMAAKVAASRAAAGQAPGAPAGAAAAPRATATASRPVAPTVSAQAARAAAAEAGRSAFRAEEPEVVTRRYVLRWLLWGSVVAWFGLAAGAGVAMFYPNKVTGFGGVIAAAKTSQVPVNVRPPLTVVEAHAYLVNPGPGVLALWWKCVHLGCTVPWVPSEDDFHCPCHGSVYLYDSQHVAGPAPRSLDLFPVMIDSHDTIWINTNPSLVYQHLNYDAKLCTPLTAAKGKWSWAKGHTL